DPVAITAYDGSVAGNPSAPLRIEIRSPAALGYLLSAPGELGLARAYVTGHLDVVGGVYDVIRALTAVVERLSTAERLAILRELGPRHLRWLPVPSEEAPSRLRRALHGIRHSKGRDSMAISR